MEGLILGIDLCDDYCRVSGIRPADTEAKDVGFAEADNRCIIQTTLGRKKDVSQWLMGKEAYEAALTGEGFVVYNLLSRLMSQEGYTAQGTEYSAQELMTNFLGRLFECAFREFGEREILKLVIAIQTVTVETMDALLCCTDKLGLARERVHIISHTEAFLYYVLSQKKEYWANESVLFDWSSNELHYYSMNVTRGVKPHVVKVEHKVLEEDFSSENLESEPIQKVVDSKLASYAQELLDKRIISSVLLSGRGLEDCSHWVKQSFLKTICSRRRVYVESSVFARGAVVVGVDDLRERTAFPYTIICEGRIPASLKMDVVSHGSRLPVTLAQQGSCWYDIRTSVDLILDNTNSIDMKAVMSGGNLVRTFSIPLDNFPKRPAKTTRVQVIVNFASENEAVVRIVDKGFGDLFPATGAVKKSRIMLIQ